jgi:hypothetical protein
MSGERAAAFAAAALLIASAGCAKPPKVDPFPIGIFSVSGPEALSRLKEDGFDAFFAAPASPGGYEALAKEARRLGMKMLADPRPLLAGQVDPRRWPLLAWYLQDEPDVNHVSPAALSKTAESVAAKDQGAQTFVVGSASAAPSYAATGDAMMLDWYPVPHLALDSVADQVDAALEALPKGKPLWFVVQAFDWREEVQSNPQKPRIGRFPEETEIRLMSYLAVMHGARGLFFFRLVRPDGKSLLDLPELWTRVTRTSRELSLLKPILAFGTPAPLPFVSDPDGPEARCWRYRGRRYVIVANRSMKAASRIAGELLKPRWRPLFEARREQGELLLRNGPDRYLRPGQVLVLEGPWRPLGE